MLYGWQRYSIKCIDTTVEKVLEELKARDYRDTHREHNPLVKVKDAIDIDTTDKTPDEVVDSIMARFF